MPPFLNNAEKTRIRSFQNFMLETTGEKSSWVNKFTTQLKKNSKFTFPHTFSTYPGKTKSFNRKWS